MTRSTGILAAACLAVLTGCTVSPLFQLERSALERNLPPDVKMSDYVGKDWFGKVTVEEKLARLGAYTDGDKIRDGTGKEIYFVKHEERSLKAAPEMLKGEQERESDRKKFGTVIEIRPDPDLKPAVAASEQKELTVKTAPATPPASKPGPPAATPAWQPTPPTGPVAIARPPDVPPAGTPAVRPSPGDGWQPAK